MSAKIIKLAEYKAQKQQKALLQLTKEVDADIKRGFQNGMCDCCGNDTSDLILLRGLWRCRACLGV